MKHEIITFEKKVALEYLTENLQIYFKDLPSFLPDTNVLLPYVIARPLEIDFRELRYSPGIKIGDNDRIDNSTINFFLASGFNVLVSNLSIQRNLLKLHESWNGETKIYESEDRISTMLPENLPVIDVNKISLLYPGRLSFISIFDNYAPILSIVSIFDEDHSMFCASPHGVYLHHQCLSRSGIL